MDIPRTYLSGLLCPEFLPARILTLSTARLHRAVSGTLNAPVAYYDWVTGPLKAYKSEKLIGVGFGRWGKKGESQTSRGKLLSASLTPTARPPGSEGELARDPWGPQMGTMDTRRH